MKLPCILVQLHEPLFLAGSDLGKKLTPNHSKGPINLFHDSESDHVIVEYKGQRAHIKNWASFNEVMDQPEKGVVNKHHDHRIAPVNAQVGGPNDVFKVQVETPIDKVQNSPKRRAKFQGEETQGE